jgi:hypothetical protein
MSQEVEMTTMTHPAVSFADSRHHPLTTAVLVGLFWLAAAALVGTAHTKIDPLSVSGGSAASIAAVFISAYCYTRLCARHAGITHALSVGIAWLVLAIATEMAMTTHLGRGWYDLIGTPDRPLLRNVFMFGWVFAPAFFAHRGFDLVIIDTAADEEP